MSIIDERLPVTTLAPANAQGLLADETVCLHGAYRSDPTNKAIAVPIYQNAAYEFATPAHTADVFACRTDGNTYSGS